MNGGGDTRVSIPNSVRKVIQEVKKTLGSKYNDEFVYTTLKDCGMDPIVAGRSLKMIHDVKEIAGKHSVEDVYAMLKECNMDPNEAAQRLLYIDTFHEVRKKHDRRKTINNDASEEYKRTRGNQWRGDKGGRGTFYSSKVFEDVGSGRNSNSGKEYGGSNRVESVSRPILPVHLGKENNGVHVANSAANVVNGTPAISNGIYSQKLAPELSADVSSSTSNPVVVSSQNTKHICAVGNIKCEIVKRSGSSELNTRIPAGIKFSSDQLVAGTNPIIAEYADSDNISQQNSDVVEKIQTSETLQPVLLLTQNSQQVVNPIQENQQAPQLPLKVIASEHTDLVPEEESEMKISAPKVDVMLEKLTLSTHQPVIFPDYIQVPENYKNQFTFGSLDAITDDCKPLSVTESSQQNDVVTEPSLSNENITTRAQEGEIQGDQLPHVSEDVVLPSPDNISVKHEQTKLEMIPPTITGFQNPVIQTTRDYNYGFMPHLMAPHFVQLDLPELQNGSTQVAAAVGPTPVTQPTMAGQSSIALSPPLFPYFRPYPNYIPYNPYIPHMYLPQNAHLLNHGVFPQPPPPTGNVHHMHVAAAKFPPSQGSNEDVITSEAKDNNIPSILQQGEDSLVWAPAPGRDIPNLPLNYFYNMAFSPLQAAALYHSSQTMTDQSTVQPPLMYPTQATGATVEPKVQPPGSYQQPQHVILNRETS